MNPGRPLAISARAALLLAAPPLAQRIEPDRRPTIEAQPPIGQALKIKALRE